MKLSLCLERNTYLILIVILLNNRLMVIMQSR